MRNPFVVISVVAAVAVIVPGGGMALAADESQSVQAAADAPSRTISVGLETGFRGFLGNRGVVWTDSSTPMVGIGAAYWIDPRLALRLGFHRSSHHFQRITSPVSVGMSDLSAGMAFQFVSMRASASSLRPYVVVSAGYFRKTEKDLAEDVTDAEGAYGVSGGVGLEVPVIPSKAALQLEGTLGTVAFDDRYSAEFMSEGIDDLTGSSYSLSAGFTVFW